MKTSKTGSFRHSVRTSFYAAILTACVMLLAGGCLVAGYRSYRAAFGNDTQNTMFSDMAAYSEQQRQTPLSGKLWQLLPARWRALLLAEEAVLESVGDAVL